MKSARTLSFHKSSSFQPTAEMTGIHRDFKTLGILSVGTAENFTQSWEDTHKRLIFFEDTDHASINDRYRITRIVDGAELAPLKIVYATDDPEYFRKIEGREPNKRDQR